MFILMRMLLMTMDDDIDDTVVLGVDEGPLS